MKSSNQFRKTYSRHCKRLGVQQATQQRQDSTVCGPRCLVEFLRIHNCVCLSFRCVVAMCDARRRKQTCSTRTQVPRATTFLIHVQGSHSKLAVLQTHWRRRKKHHGNTQTNNSCPAILSCHKLPAVRTLITHHHVRAEAVYRCPPAHILRSHLRGADSESLYWCERLRGHRQQVTGSGESP